MPKFLSVAVAACTLATGLMASAPNVPIVALVPADKSDIKPGAIVFVPTEKQADGTLLSGAILFGKDALFLPCRLFVLSLRRGLLFPSPGADTDQR